MAKGWIEIILDAPGGIKRVSMETGLTGKEALSMALGRLGLPLDKGILTVRINKDMYSVVPSDKVLEPGQYVIKNTG